MPLLITIIICFRFLTIQGKPAEASEMARDSTANAYSSYYSTEGYAPSKRGTREILVIGMKVSERYTNSLILCMSGRNSSIFSLQT